MKSLKKFLAYALFVIIVGLFCFIVTTGFILLLTLTDYFTHSFIMGTLVSVIYGALIFLGLDVFSTWLDNTNYIQEINENKNI